jgi:transcriptional regulator with XRE-family HTH domain
MNLDELPLAGVESELGDRIAVARIASGLTQAQLGVAAGVAKRTVERLEAGDGCQFSSVLAILKALGRLGRLELVLPSTRPTPLEQLAEASQSSRSSRPRRVRRTPAPAPDNGPFQWGDQQ